LALILFRAWIINAGLRAISSRREYTKKIERATASDDSGRKKSNYTHSYFVSRLEEAILALRPLFANSSASNSSELGSQSGDNIEVLINCFEALHLEEPTEQPDEKERTPVESTGPVYDVELSKDEKDVTAEKHFALFCLFQDLARLRKFVQDLWSDYASDRVDLITASVATNASFQIAARKCFLMFYASSIDKVLTSSQERRMNCLQRFRTQKTIRQYLMLGGKDRAEKALTRQKWTAKLRGGFWTRLVIS
jgi:hypothetical protein